MNHEPGPSTTQSASRIAVDGLRAGRRVVGLERDRARSRPSVVATSTWPRTVVSASGSPGPGPRTSAAMSSGVSAIGSTRPGGAEQPADPVERLHVVAEQLPERRRSAGCRRRGRASRPSPANRCWSTSRPGRGPSRRRRRAPPAPSAGRPGGSTPNSPRSRPDEPPLSATVTTAVRSSTTRSSTRRRSADSEACSPCPPPRRRRPTGRRVAARHSRPRSRWVARAS